MNTISEVDLPSHRAIDSRKYAWATLAYVIVTFAIAATWHFVLFADLYAKLAIFTRKEPIVPLGLSSMLVQGLVMAYTYPKVSQRRKPLRDGLIFGLVCGLFIASAAVLGEAGKQNVTSLWIFLGLESVYYAVQFGISGLTIALVYGRREH